MEPAPSLAVLFRLLLLAVIFQSQVECSGGGEPQHRHAAHQQHRFAPSFSSGERVPTTVGGTDAVAARGAVDGTRGGRHRPHNRRQSGGGGFNLLSGIESFTNSIMKFLTGGLTGGNNRPQHHHHQAPTPVRPARPQRPIQVSSGSFVPVSPSRPSSGGFNSVPTIVTSSSSSSSHSSNGNNVAIHVLDPPQFSGSTFSSGPSSSISSQSQGSFSGGSSSSFSGSNSGSFVGTVTTSNLPLSGAAPPPSPASSFSTFPAPPAESSNTVSADGLLIPNNVHSLGAPSYVDSQVEPHLTQVSSFVDLTGDNAFVGDSGNSGHSTSQLTPEQQQKIIANELWRYQVVNIKPNYKSKKIRKPNDI